MKPIDRFLFNIRETESRNKMDSAASHLKYPK